jgi:hypothetical protein
MYRIHDHNLKFTIRVEKNDFLEDMTSFDRQLYNFCVVTTIHSFNASTYMDEHDVNTIASSTVSFEAKADR